MPEKTGQRVPAIKLVPMLFHIMMGLTHRKTVGPTLRMAGAAIRWFFIPQFQTVLFPKTRPVVDVGHELDAAIPFTPSLVEKYLQFVQLWMSSVYLLRKRYGMRAMGVVGSYIDAIASLYEEAGTVYCRVQSTTDRPKEKANARFAFIHAFDPHLHCVPSLHVLIVLVNWMLAGEAVRRLGDPEGEWETEFVGWTRDEALRIVETILFVKQHSLNCVGASYYYLNARNPEKFDDGAIREINDALFTYEGGTFVDAENAERLRATMLGVYDRLKGEEATTGASWDDVIVSFMENLDRERKR